MSLQEKEKGKEKEKEKEKKCERKGVQLASCLSFQGCMILFGAVCFSQRVVYSK